MLPRRRRPARLVRRVAILTGPGGSVLLETPTDHRLLWHIELRSSPAPEGRCCEHAALRLLTVGFGVAILTGPGGSVLPSCPPAARA